MARSSHHSRRQRGLSLVEILVGVLIGMIGIVVIFQVLATAEQRKRTTGAGTDAQVAGVIALQTIERDIRLSGYGFGSSNSVGCTVDAYDAGRPSGGLFNFILTPVQIVQGLGGEPDTIITLWGNSALFAASQGFNAPSPTRKVTQGSGGILPGDRMLAANGDTCALIEITRSDDPDHLTVLHEAGTYTTLSGATRLARYNTASGIPGLVAGHLYNLGEQPRRNIWSLRDFKTITITNDLMYVDANGDGLNDWIQVSDGVIDIQADYGIDADGDNRISGTEWTTADPVAWQDWGKLRAVRVALLVRSAQYEKPRPDAPAGQEHATNTAPVWEGGSFVMRNVDGTTDTQPAGDNNWRNYRYRVYQTTIPLRNMIWGPQP